MASLGFIGPPKILGPPLNLAPPPPNLIFCSDPPYQLFWFEIFRSPPKIREGCYLATSVNILNPFQANVPFLNPLMASSPPMKMGWGFIFQGQWGVCLFTWTLGGLVHVGGVTIRDFPVGDSSSNFLPNWQMQNPSR